MITHTVLPSSTRPEAAMAPASRNPGPVSRNSKSQSILLEYFHILSEAFGTQKWWPGRTRFEIIVGAILTQNTNWSNVQRAIGQLRRKRLLHIAGIASMPVERLATLIRSSGYFRQKARKLQEFVAFLESNHDGSLNKMFSTPTKELREQLLAVHGIGPETADSILLYAGKHPVFVVDAYTRRILERHELLPEKNGYEDIRGLMEKSLPRDVSLFNEYHALLVHVGKTFCRPKAPNCSTCPLYSCLPHPIEGAR
jgi:endonuclease-3 related protein